MKRPRRSYLKLGPEARDFFIGFVGFFIVNIILWLIVSSVFPPRNYFSAPPDSSLLFSRIPVIDAIIYALMCFLNIGALVLLGVARRQIAFGVLAAFALCFAIVTLFSVVAGACYVGINAYIENY